MSSRKKEVDENARNHTLSVRVSLRELNEIRQRASADGRTCAGYARRVLFTPTRTSTAA